MGNVDILFILQTSVFVTKFFPRLKENMLGVRFEDLEELKDAMGEQVWMYERGCLAMGIQKLPRW